jgi:hypothetical protein
MLSSIVRRTWQGCISIRGAWHAPELKGRQLRPFLAVFAGNAYAEAPERRIPAPNTIA